MKKQDLLKWPIRLLLVALGFILASSSFLMAQQKKLIAPAVPAKATSEKSTLQEGLGVQDHEIEGVEVVLLEAKRTSGDTITVKWKYRNQTKEKKELVKSTSSWSDAYRFSLDAYLIDPLNKKKYLVLKDEKGNPIATRHELKQLVITLAPGQTISTWAKFPAPPAQVEKISIYIPSVSPFEDIPISK
jgi:hypothetical protein